MNNFHPSHEIVDISDVSIKYDYTCSYCPCTDDQLSEPCEGLDIRIETEFRQLKNAFSKFEKLVQYLKTSKDT